MSGLTFPDTHKRSGAEPSGVTRTSSADARRATSSDGGSPETERAMASATPERSQLPEQHPDPAPRYRFRPRSDRYDFPRFTGPYRLDVESFEPRDLDWRDLADWRLWTQASVVMAAIVIVLIVVLSSGPMPA